MGVVRSTESREAELEEFRWMFLQDNKIGFESSRYGYSKGGGGTDGDGGVGDDGRRMVCVTSGVSYVGFALVNRLLSRGFSVRLAVETQEDLEKLREMEMFEGRDGEGVCAVMANVMELDSLCEAFDSCVGVFHTSAFADPGGISGYSKHMAEMEAAAAGKVIEACVRTPSVRRCVFTSSLLACVWPRNYTLSHRRLPTVLDESCWSDESLCRDRKLWFALGKTMAEKAAWRGARGRDVKLATVCQGLVTGPGFCRRNPSGSIAYLKGGREMCAEGRLATVDIGKVAEAHVCVYEAMGGTACGRYICFDSVVNRAEDAAELERQLGLPNRISDGAGDDHHHPTSFELSNRKLSQLMSRRRRRCLYDVR